MTEKKQNLSEYSAQDAVLAGIERMRFGIVVAEWNNHITDKLLDGAVSTLLKSGAREENIFVKHVPGSFELVFGAKRMMDKYQPNAVIVLGCVIQGDTPHFTYVCQGVTQGIAELNAQGAVPVIYGLVTTLNMEQAEERAGGKHGNKGVEGAITAIKMLKAFPV